MTSRPLTPSQTVGPFFHDCMLGGRAADAMVAVEDGHDRISINGRVLDGDGAGVPDAMVEAWHQDAFVRVGTDSDGAFSIATVRPGRVAFDGSTMQAPHLSVAVFARGLLNHLLTRIYFADEPSTATDSILARVPETRRETLVAKRQAGASLTRSYRFDIVLQGERETVFFDFRVPRR